MEHSRPLIKTDINRASRLLFYFFTYANITIQQDNFKHIALFFNNISIIPKFPVNMLLNLHQSDLIKPAPILSGQVKFAIYRISGDAIQDIGIFRPQVFRKQT